MVRLARWSPMRDMARAFDDMNRVFDEMGLKHQLEEGVRGTWMPAADIRETADAIELEMEMPGVDRDKIDVSLEQGVLTIKGERAFRNEQEGETYHRVERAYGNFERSFSLPRNVDQEQVKAAYNDGVLHLTLPKREEAKPRSIAIDVK